MLERDENCLMDKIVAPFGKFVTGLLLNLFCIIVVYSDLYDSNTNNCDGGKFSMMGVGCVL
jgi:hypothetical protein